MFYVTHARSQERLRTQPAGGRSQTHAFFKVLWLEALCTDLKVLGPVYLDSEPGCLCGLGSISPESALPLKCQARVQFYPLPL